MTTWIAHRVRLDRARSAVQAIATSRGLWELSLGIYCIVKGFRSSAPNLAMDDAVRVPDSPSAREKASRAGSRPPPGGTRRRTGRRTRLCRRRALSVCLRSFVCPAASGREQWKRAETLTRLPRSPRAQASSQHRERPERRNDRRWTREGAASDGYGHDERRRPQRAREPGRGDGAGLARTRPDVGRRFVLGGSHRNGAHRAGRTPHARRRSKATPAILLTVAKPG